MSFDFEEARRSLDIAEVASRYTALNRNKQGSCPICGGTDRFYIINAELCGCRKCPNSISTKNKTWDAISLVAQIENLSMGEALTLLMGQGPPARLTRTAPSAPTPLTDAEWQASARKVVEASKTTLLGTAGRPGRD